jgi:mutator protein MutT
VIHVAAGVLVDRSGRVLIAQRPPGKHLAGAWEFPGGKLERGERPAEGLRRELKEEIGVEIERPRPLLRLRHTYSHGQVLLDVWVVRRYRGEPKSLDGQALRWCRRRELASADLLPADRPIVRALWLPERLTRTRSPYYEVVSTDSRGSPEAGSTTDGVAIADPEIRDAKSASAASKSQRARHSARSKAHLPPLKGVLCLNPAEARAAAADAGFLVLQEIMPPAELAALCEEIDVPVFARGVSLGRAWELGATGINAISRVTP